MAPDNTSRPGTTPDDPEGAARAEGAPSETAEGVPVAGMPVPSATGAGAALTPGQRLAAKKAQKALDKREFKDELRARAEAERQKELAEADRIFGRVAPQGGLPDDVAKAAGTFTDFLQRNRGRILGGVGAAIAIAAIALGAQRLLKASATEQAEALGEALDVASAPIDADDADGKTDDGKPVYKSVEARTEAALAAFARAAAQGDEGASAWAGLGQAAAELRLGKLAEAQQHFQKAYEAHAEQKPLAARALEGLGIAQEAAGKTAEAVKSYEKLKELEGNKQLAAYHLARMKLAQGDREGGKALLKGLYDELRTPTEGGSASRYLRNEVEVRLAELDSSLVSSAQPMVLDPSMLGDPSQMNEEQIKRLIEQLKKGNAPPAGGGGQE